MSEPAVSESAVPTSPTVNRPVVPGSGRLRPLGVDEIRITGGFWGRRQDVNATATLDHCLTTMERLGWVANFRATAAGEVLGQRPGREFSDSEVYKLTEAMGWEIARSGDTAVSAAADKLVGEISAAQQPDGYLNTAFGGPGQPARYSDLEWGHELYCAGFVIQAAVAHNRVAGNEELLSIATRLADHICREFGPTGIEGVCGHPEIEMALVELARVTGEERYLDQAARFVERRGRGLLGDINLGRAYFQDEVPVRQATVLRGHAVRALYLAAGAVDVAVETGDDALLQAIAEQWEHTVGRRTYLTGGMGSRHTGEAFGRDFELPPDRAYSETCAGVASVMLGWRLLLATGDPRYADLIERTLFNVVATSPADDGRSFFYVNTLHQRTLPAMPPSSVPNPRPVSGLRASWFEVSCCPTNVARMLASLSGYLATVDDDGLQLHQYADASIRTSIGGTPIALTMRTDYPDGGAISVTVDRAPTRPVTFAFRVPSWAGDRASITPPGEPARPAGPGMVRLNRVFRPGEVIRLELPVEPRWTTPDLRIDAVRGQLAVERGPVVMCVESVDLPGTAEVDGLRVDPTSAPVVRAGTVVVDGDLLDVGDEPWPYRNGGPPSEVRASRDIEIPLRPYHSWAERGPAAMRVWLPAR